MIYRNFEKEKDVPMKTKIIFVCAFLLLISGCATNSPLIKATKDGDILATEKLIREGANIHESDESGYTPLMYAIWSGKQETVTQLVNIGADVNKRDNSGYTPLLWAASYGYLDMAKLLIDKGADVNARGNDKSSPLLLALAANNHELSKLLIDRGADIHVVDVNGTTPLILAAMYGDYDIAKILVEKDVDLFAVDASGYKASDYVKFSLKTGKRVFQSDDYERNLSFLKLIKKAENAQILAGRMNTKNPKMARIYSIVYKVGKCINSDVDYDVFISNKNEPNAWVNISGNITFTKEALEKFDDDALTFVAAHEIAHDKLGHVAKKMAVSSTITGALVVANVFLPGAGLLNHIINPTITNNYSKTQEYDADQMASVHCAQCFDMSIERQIAIMQKIEKISKSSGGGFWATHPSWENRIKSVATTTKASSEIRNTKTTTQSPSPLMEGDQRHKEIKGIVLNDGNVVEGKIIKMSADAVMIQAEDGKVSTYSFEKEVRGFVK